jgi:UDP-N-acetylmuramoylalanine--D-glutamate ligase
MTQSNTQALLIPGSIQLDTKDSISILVMGTGESGQAMARWAVAQGAQVRMHDTREAGAISEKAQDQLEELKQLNINISFGKNIAGIDLRNFS